VDVISDARFVELHDSAAAQSPEHAGRLRGLGPAHVRAHASDEVVLEPEEMAPVVLDRGRIGLDVPAAARDRPAGQLALGALMLFLLA
jgi:hypothetical protein